MRTIQSLLKIGILIGIICYIQYAVSANAEPAYVVVKGDSVASICQKFQLSTKELLTANPSLNPKRLTVGQQLNIPPRSQGGENTSAPSWPSANSPLFKAALNYGIAQTLYSTFEFNSWNSFSDSKMAQSARQKLGKSVNAQVFISKGDDFVRISAVLPDFSIENRKLVLVFSYDGTNCFFVDSKFGEDTPNSSASEMDVNLILPQDYRAVVRADFNPKADKVTRIRRCCQEMLKSNYPAKANATNHFFLAPYSEKYDYRPVSLYWVEGKRVIQIDHLSYPDGTDGFLPKEMSDFSEPVQAENASDYASSYEWQNFTVSRHVLDGLLLIVEPDNSK